MKAKEENKITFTQRPIPIYPGYRPMYKIALILLVLKINSTGSKASLLKLHLFSWALKQNTNLLKLKDYALLNLQSDLKFFGIEPSLNRALNLAVAENLVRFDKGKYIISDKGDVFVGKILKDSTLFSKEKDILITIGKSVNETKIMNLKKHWENGNA